VAFAVHVNCPAAVRGAFSCSDIGQRLRDDHRCHLRDDDQPHLFFWQAAQEVEEIHRISEDKPLRIAFEQQARYLRRMRSTRWGHFHSEIDCTQRVIHQHGSARCGMQLLKRLAHTELRCTRTPRSILVPWKRLPSARSAQDPAMMW
jgi:hypothetical protein